MSEIGANEDTRLSSWLTAQEVAVLLRTTSKAVYVMISRGQLPGVARLGRRVLVSRNDLLEWLNQKRTPSLEESQ